MKNHLENIRNSDKSNIEKTMDYLKYFTEYQSITLQTLDIGNNPYIGSEKVNNTKLIPVINEKLKEKGENYTFNNISDFGRLSQLIVQAASSLKSNIDDKLYEVNISNHRTYSFIDYSKIASIMAELNDNVWNSNKGTDDVIKSFYGDKMLNILATYTMALMYEPSTVGKDGIDELRNFEDKQLDFYLDDKLSKFASQLVPYNFSDELETLANAFGDQLNNMDPNFNDMTKGLNKLNEVYKDPNSNDALKLTALRYAQKVASDYLDSHKDDLSSDSPLPQTLLAEKIFTLAGVEKLALRGNLEPGFILQGKGEYKDHDLSLDSIMKMAPTRLNVKRIKATRYNGLHKHANASDILKDARKHIEDEITVDYSKIDKITDKKDVVVHSGLSRKQRDRGEYSLEFVCAGSSHVQMAKLYKGQSGRSEIVKPERVDDPILKEITDNVRAKYKFNYEEKGDNNRFEWALEQEYGKPMYLDDNKVLHESEVPGSHVMPGIRKMEKGTTTRYNVSGTLSKILGFIGKNGISNTGEHSINSNKDYMIGLAEEWLSNIYGEYETKIKEGKKSELKPINISFKGHSRGGVAANEASLMVNHLVEHKYPLLRDYVHISTQLLDPVPGLGSNLMHPGVDLKKSDYKLTGRDMRGLKVSSVEEKNNQATVFYSIHSNHDLAFSPQSVKGVDRMVLSCMNHDMGIFDSVDGHKQGYVAENGEEYRGTGFNELDKGLYFIDENKNMISCKNSQEAHKAIDAMLGKHAKFSRQGSRHEKLHDMVDTWYKSHPEIITEKDTRYPIEEAMKADRNVLNTVLEVSSDLNVENTFVASHDEIYKRAISSLIAHGMLLDDMKSNKSRIYPESKDKTRDLLKKSEESGVADKIRESADFKLFYDNLDKDDIKKLASGDPTELKSYLDAYKAVKGLSSNVKKEMQKDVLARKSKDAHLEANDIRAFLTKKMSDSLGKEFDPNRFNEYVNFFVTYGDDKNRNHIFTGNEDRMEQIKAAMESGKKVFVTLPDMVYHTMDIAELTFTGGELGLDMPKMEYEAMSMSVSEICKGINETGESIGDSDEFKEFKAKLNEVAEMGIPKEKDAFFNTLNDLSTKAFVYAVSKLDQNMNERRDKRFTEASQIIEIYRGICTHEKPSNDNMNLNMIASKFLKVQLLSELKSDNPQNQIRARGMLNDMDLFLEGIKKVAESESFKSKFKDMSSKDLEKFAHKNAKDIAKELTKDKVKVQEQNIQIL